MRRLKHNVVLAICAVTVAVAVFAASRAFILRPQSTNNLVESKRQAQQPPAAPDLALIRAQAPSIPIAENRAAIEEGLSVCVADPEGLLSPDQHTLLIETLVSNVLARTGTAEELESFCVKAPATRWVSPADTQPWAVLQSWQGVDFAAAQQQGPRAVEELLATVLKQACARSLDEMGCRFVGVAPNQQGCWADAMHVRTRDEIVDIISLRLGDEQSVKFWYGDRTVSPWRLRVPIRSLEEVITQEHTALVVVSHLLIKNSAGSIVNWLAYWYWDSASSTWQCDTMAGNGWPAILVL